MSEFPRLRDGGVTIVEAAGRLDALAAAQLDRSLQQALASGQARLVVDMSEVPYISSSCLRILLMGARRARLLGGDLRLCSLSARVRQVFVLAGFDQVLQLAETRVQALASFSALPDGSEGICASA